MASGACNTTLPAQCMLILSISELPSYRLIDYTSKIGFTTTIVPYSRAHLPHANDFHSQVNSKGRKACKSGKGNFQNPTIAHDSRKSLTHWIRVQNQQIENMNECTRHVQPSAITHSGQITMPRACCLGPHRYIMVGLSRLKLSWRCHQPITAKYGIAHCCPHVARLLNVVRDAGLKPLEDRNKCCECCRTEATRREE